MGMPAMPWTRNCTYVRRSKRALLLTSMLCCGLQLMALGASPAAAQTASAASAAAPDTVQEVVVTAERRAETVANVPMSITAISSGTLTKFDIQNFGDYAQLV